MSRADRVLTWLLRLLGASALGAVVAVVLPLRWMHAIHGWLGLGAMPSAPIVEYLARSVSGFYVLFGVLCLIIAADLPRYRPLARFLGGALALFGLAFLVIDPLAGLPLWWTLVEGPPGIVLGGLLLYLAKPGRCADVAKSAQNGPGH
jgi:hypothetical protein